MSRNYDNWERLVAAVIKREEIWVLCHQDSRSPSICSEASSSDFSSSFRVDNEQESTYRPIPKLVLLEGFWESCGQLGKGRFGDSILIQLRRGVWASDHEFLAEGTQLVMELVDEVKVTEEEFKTVFGKCRHENVAAPRAYHFSNNGNYIFNDYHNQRNLYDMLHGLGRGRDRGFCNWESRLKIAIGAARGIAHIHHQCDGKLAHGNIRASNIFINSDKYGCVSDFGLANIMRTSRETGTLDYHASEYEFKNSSHESDVYCFGVLLLELITGTSPIHPPKGTPKFPHIVEWARSIRPEDWRSKLFDKRLPLENKFFCDELVMLDFIQEKNIPLGGYSGIDITVLGEKVYNYLESIEVEKEQILQVAMKCLAKLPHERPKMQEVVLLLGNVESSRNAPTP